MYAGRLSVPPPILVLLLFIHLFKNRCGRGGAVQDAVRLHWDVPLVSKQRHRRQPHGQAGRGHDRVAGTGMD